MSIYKPKHSKNYICVFKVRGQWFRKSTGTANRKEAELKEREFRKQFIDENRGLRQQVSFGKALDMYIESKEGTPNRKNLRRNAQVLTSLCIRSTPLHEIDTKDINRFVAEQKRAGSSNSTIKHRLPDPKYPKLKTTRGRTRVLSDDEMLAVENELHPDRTFGNYHISEDARRFRQDAYDLWILFCGTGARFTEISKLEWSQVNLTNRTILLYRPKVDNETVLVMTDKVFDVLSRRARRPQSRRYVFTGRNGQAREYSGAAIRKAIRRAGLGPDVTPHVIRHTVATRLLESGLNIQEVQHIMGHADQNTTARYLHASTQMSARRAADVLNGRSQKPKLELVT
jgi:integrase